MHLIDLCLPANGDVAARPALLKPARGEPRAIVIELHGSGLDPERQYRAGRLTDAPGLKDFTIVLPQAAVPFRLMPGEPPGFAWNVPGSALPGEAASRDDLPDDVAWIQQPARSIRAERGGRTTPIFLVGYCGGARLASHLIARGEVAWAGAALVAGCGTFHR